MEKGLKEEKWWNESGKLRWKDSGKQGGKWVEEKSWWKISGTVLDSS